MPRLLALLLWLASLPALAWLEGGRPGPLAREAVALLQDAASHGLDPADYDAQGLAQALEQAPASLPSRLDEALPRYLTDLHQGRVDPRTLSHGFTLPPRDAFDAGALLRDARARGRLADAVAAATPALPAYTRLREALAQYRALAGHPAWRVPLPALPRGRKLEPGQGWPGLPLLAERLLALGDLPQPPAAAPERLEGPLAEAVRLFQRRHGLAADGVLGRATLAALQVTPAARLRQIELTLERLRWTPLLQGPRMIVINIPEYMLRAYEVVDGRIQVPLAMKVVVGKAADTRTPLFDAELRSVEFSPYWNVPPSIARGEVVPRLRRDPGYWDREGFEFVGPGGDVETGLSPARLDAVLAGGWRIRQRPGPRNALGDIKFVFPNHDHIYLHHTPAVGLFERDRRDFSHGCIRVEGPVELARFVLRGQPGWDEARIRAAMGAGRSETLRLDAPPRVLIAYGTALVKDGRIHFYDDVYGHDRRLDAALRARSPRP